MKLKKDIQAFLSGLLKNATLRNIIRVGILTVFVSLLGFFKEILVADRFGLSELLDTFLIAVLVPMFIFGVFFGSFQSVFIPNYVTEMKTGKNIGSFQSTSFLLTLGVSIFFLIIAFLFTDVYLETFFKGHTPQYYALIKKQFYYVAPCIIFWGFSGLLKGLLTIDDEFIHSSVSGIFTPLAIIICILFFRDQFGDLVLAMGTLIGGVMGTSYLLIFALRRNLIHLKKPDFDSVNIRILFKQLPAKLSSSMLNNINPLIDQYFAAQLIVGSIAALNYGIKIPTFAITIAGLALSNVLLPYFSKQAVENYKATFDKLKIILRYIMISSGLVVVVLALLSTPLITIIFERNAFTAADTIIVSKIQQMYLLQIPFYITGLIMVKFLTSINRNNFMVLTSLISLILNIVLNYILIRQMEVYGLALATSLVAFVNSLILYFYILKLNKADHPVV
ncbi:MAG: virulence factor MviN [Flavobacteriaceae bacterium]|nr:polysaccharide biosynthesis C-terminal domain-containing protein [Bacteroidia bacterium]MBT8288599.1 polysaccharide biosynthesis C-terminal domain-containing protein [Bacteroidia bacterium]NNF76001.1 virulence factor MviN [Flavobacteriaceae bacterium]NNK72285.1 virulence factor MviN [Flavobacteriaceae bacterium]NNL81330.1 virulence factor MviN [Flavobacteriaceae bacterium]